MFFKNKREKKRIIKRKSYYSFSSSYPGTSQNKNYFIGENRIVKRREFLRRLLIGVLIFLIFAIAFVVTDICLNISGRPI